MLSRSRVRGPDRAMTRQVTAGLAALAAATGRDRVRRTAVVRDSEAGRQPGSLRGQQVQERLRVLGLAGGQPGPGGVRDAERRGAGRLLLQRQAPVSSAPRFVGGKCGHSTAIAAETAYKPGMVGSASRCWPLGWRGEGGTGESWARVGGGRVGAGLGGCAQMSGLCLVWGGSRS